MHDYNTALQSHQRVLAIRIKLFGEEHQSTAKKLESTADNYRDVVVTQHEIHY